MQIALEVGYRYRQIVNKYHSITCEDSVEPAHLLGDFSMRGQHSIDSAVKASAAWCMSFLNTATVPAIPWLEKYYNCNCETEPVAFGAISTEHSVMCSNAAIDGDEITHIKRLLTEIYPNQNFSMVSDSYDYWNLVDNILPQCREEIMNHNGTLSIRGDSGDPVEVVTRTVFKLWKHFGGTINSKGYKVLDPHVKAIYGDSITPQRCEAIYEILEEAGFSIQNVSLGVGSFSFMCLEEFIEDEANWESGEKIVKYNPYTRDTFGVAVKATYMEDKDGNPIPIFKNPKEASFKKSQKGCCSVYLDEQNEIVYKDELTYTQRVAEKTNMLEPVFANGKMIKEYTLAEVRNRLHKGEF
jgi:nicotinamide phosphoribosyltransferase